MKKYIYTMVLGLILSACTKKEDTTIVISVLEDVTETNFIAKPNAETITSFFGFQDDLWHSVTFRYSRITSLTMNSRDVIFIEQEHHLLGNELQRRRLVADFKKKSTSLLQAKKDSPVYRYSSIWLPLIEELKEVQKDSVSTEIYLFSDLRENTKFFSTYKATDMNLLAQNSGIVLNLFLKKSEGVQSSNKIKVIVVYQPRTIAEDELFQKLKQLYVQLFSRIGISIEFTSKLNARSL